MHQARAGFGVFTERDALRVIAGAGAGGWQAPLREHTTPATALVCVAPATSLVDALSVVHECGARHLPVVRMADAGHEALVAVVSMREMLAHAFEHV